ncbi:MAG: sterol desaturase family protein [Bacteroidia bacterium]
MSIVILSIPLFFILIGIELVYDRIQHAKLYRLNDAVTNISCGILDQLMAVSGGVITVLLYTFFQKLSPFTVEQTWWNWIILFLLYDLAYYWAHRMSHEINLFWAGHVVHHQSEDYNLSVALRQGAFQKFFSMWFYVPIALMGFDNAWFLTVVGINLVYQFWIHTEAINRFPPWIEFVFNTPSHHRVHHGRDPKYIDKNHAGVFIIWDRIFGTFQKEEEKPTYGITTPINSWNPVYAQVQHFGTIYRDLGKMKGLKNKFRLLFNKPGWYPEELGGYRAPQAVDHSAYHKFDLRMSPKLNYYLLSQYIILLGITAFFLFQVSSTPALQAWLIGGWIVLGVLSLGLLFEGKKWAVWLEAGRVVLGLAGLGWLLFI